MRSNQIALHLPTSARPTSPRFGTRHGRTYIAITVYLVVFAVLVAVLSHYYLIPALKASQHATPQERKKLAAGAMLLLMVVLFVLGAGLLLTFRVGRFFFPRSTQPAKPTKYVDAWAESGRRMQTPPAEEGDPP